MAENALGMYGTTEQYITPYLPLEAQEHKTEWERKRPTNLCLQRVLPMRSRVRCMNCQDDGQVYLSFIRAGPFHRAPGHSREESLCWFDGNDLVKKGWYIVVKTRAYECPACQGRPETVAEPEGQTEIPWWHGS